MASKAGLTEYEKKELKQGFKLLNKDNDDVLSFDDLKQQLKALKFDFTDQQLHDLLLVATGSNTGKVTWTQFLHLFEHKDQNQLTEEITLAFQSITEKDKISKDDLKKFFQSIGMEATEQEIDEMVEHHGTNGKISQNEMTAMFHL